MILSIIMGRRLWRMSGYTGRETIMWIIELNVGGYQFTREIPDFRRPAFRFHPLRVHWPVLRHSHAA